MVAVFANTSLTIMTIHNIHPIMIIREMSEQFYLVLFLVLKASEGSILH